MEKIGLLVRNYYQLHGHSNRTNYLKSVQIGLKFLNPNPNKVYDMTTGFL